MKSLLTSLSLLFISQLNAQCVKLYINEHLSGSPICNLASGDYIEICEDWNEVNGCPRDLYIYKKGSSSGNLTYELSLDKGWSIHYMTLMVNPTTKRFGFILQGQTAMYSYYNESEIAEVRKHENERLKEEKKILDQKIQTISSQIDIEIQNANFKTAIELLDKLPTSERTKNFEKINAAAYKNPIQITIDKSVVDTILLSVKKTRYDLQAGNLTIRSTINAGIEILNDKEELILKVSEQPYKTKIGQHYLPAVFNYNFSYLEKTTITKEEVLNKYVLARTLSNSIEEVNKKTKKIKSIQTISEISTEEIPFPLKYTQVWLAPNLEGRKLEGQGIVFEKSYFDGTTGASTSMQTDKKDMTEEEIAAKKKSTGLFPEMNYTTSGMTYEILGIEAVNGADAYVLKLNDGETESFDYFDVKTFYKLKTTTFVKDGDKIFENTVTRSDFREVNGVIFPFKVTIRNGGMANDAIQKVTNVIINGKIKLKDYQ